MGIRFLAPTTRPTAEGRRSQARPPNKRLKLTAPGCGRNCVCAPTRSVVVSVVAAPARCGAQLKRDPLDGAHALMSGQMRLGPDSPGQCEPGLSDDRPRDPRLCYCPELSPRATRSSSS